MSTQFVQPIFHPDFPPEAKIAEKGHNFKSLLLLGFYLDQYEFSTRQTRTLRPQTNGARILNFHPDFMLEAKIAEKGHNFKSLLFIGF